MRVHRLLQLAVASVLVLGPLTAPPGVAGGSPGLTAVKRADIPPAVKLAIDFEAIQAATEAEREGDIEGAFLILDGAIERSPDDGTLITARGALRLAQGDQEAARVDFRQAIAANSNDPSGFAGLCLLAVLDGAPMQIEDACTAARNRNIVDPVYGQIMMATTILEADLGGVEVGTLDTLAVANPFVPAVRLLSLEANLRADKHAMARGDLQLLWQVYAPPRGGPPRILDRIAAFKLADVVGADIPCYLALAEVRLDWAEDRTSSGALVEQALTCRPGDETLRARRVVQLQRDAMTARDSGEHARAVGLFLEALALQPDDPILLSNLAHTAFEGSDLATAEAALRALLALTPDDPELRRNYGVTLMTLGREDEASTYLEDVEGSP